ncbi:MAG: hypothetical protein LBR55_04725 [Bacteroidales bacterium]|nr:hypothetical protein [Bacteroidales bacterium]
MVKLLLLLIYFLYFSISTFAQREITYYYDDGVTISSKGTIEQGKPNGYWKNYYESGVLKSEGKRTDFELDSVWNFYFPSGKLQQTITYAHSKKHGEYREYKETDTLHYLYCIMMYEYDKRHGLAQFYTKHGLLYQQIPFENDIRHGLAYEYDSLQTLCGVTKYEHNEEVYRKVINRIDEQGKKHGTWQTYYPNGMLQSESEYNHGLLHGAYALYTVHGQIQDVGFFENDSLKDKKNNIETFVLQEKITYYNNQSVRSRGIYYNTKPIGLHVYYKSNGEIKYADIYDSLCTLYGKGYVDTNNIKQGMWKFYTPQEQVVCEGNYENGKRHGLWKWYYESGRVQAEGFYSADNMVQTWKQYYESGNLHCVEEYENGKRNGEVVQFNEYGTKNIEGNYKENEKHGAWIVCGISNTAYEQYDFGSRVKTWKTVYANKKLQFKGNYVNNNPHGKHSYYYDNGNIEHVEYYNHGTAKKTWLYYNRDGKLNYSIRN